MKHSRPLCIALALSCGAGVASAVPQGSGEVDGATRPHPRDPDRGLDAALRERLALVDAARDTWVVERWAELIDARLALVAKLWSEDRLRAGLEGESWIAPELRVAPLFALAGSPGDSAEVRGPWRVSHTSLDRPEGEERAPEQPFAEALAAWRGVFAGESRLHWEVLAIDGEEPELEAEIRLTASGARDATRVQHDVTWRSTWRLASSQPPGVELTALRPQSFASATLSGHPQGLFTDVTESVLGDGPLWREDLSHGLDHWRRIVPAALEPGSLGHHGLALGDVNGDGLEDVYLCRPGGLPNKLLLHGSDDGLRDVSADSGTDLLDYSSSALFIDLDGDSDLGGDGDVDLDLVVSTGTGLVFFAGDGGGRFEQRHFASRSLATSLAAADVDLDGDLDVYACSYISPFEKNGLPLPYHEARNGEANQLLRNDGEWRFTDATAALGLDERDGPDFSLAAAFEDYDADGDPDLFVANDFGSSDLYRNERELDPPRFRDVAAELWTREPAAGMGVTWGDADGDGWLDVYVTNMHSPAGHRLTARPGFRAGLRPEWSAEIERAYRHHARGNTLLLNQQGRGFRDVTEASGTALGRWGWGSIFLDLDDDGALDLFAPNGFVSGERSEDLGSFFWREVVLQSPDAPGEPHEGYRLGWKAVRRLMRQGYSWNGNERNVAFLNLGEARFADVSSAAGLDHPDDARAAARVDWDGDGDEDLLVTNRTPPMLRVLRNELAAERAWIAFTLESERRTAIGARVELETESGRRLVRTLQCGEGFLAQATARVHFGLGSEGVRRVAVRWPGAGRDGELEDFGSPSAGAAWALARGAGRARELSSRAPSARLVASRAEPPPRAESARTVLPVPLPLPRLALESADGRATSLLGISMQGPRGTGEPLLVVAWSVAPSVASSVASSSSESACRTELERLAAAAELLHGREHEAAIQVLAVNVDPPEHRERARATLAELAWPFGVAFASEEALQILELVHGELHDDERLLPLPAAFLIDPAGQLVATYVGRLDPEQLRADLGLFELSPEERRNACVPFPGRWIVAPPASLEPDVAARLAAHGLERPAGEYRLARVEVRQLGSAQGHYEAGVAHQREGRFQEAVASYRRALAADPAHLRAAQNIGVALHELGELPAAMDAYRAALKLDPGHARTRANLGYLHLDLDDLQGAKNELAALRTLKSDMAAKLDERIRQYEKR